MTMMINATLNMLIVDFDVGIPELHLYPLQQQTHVLTPLINFEEQPREVQMSGGAAPRVAIALGEFVLLIFYKEIHYFDVNLT